MSEINTQPELDRIRLNGTGFLRNDGTWHNIASLQPSLGKCGTDVMVVGGYKKFFVPTYAEVPANEARCPWCLRSNPQAFEP